MGIDPGTLSVLLGVNWLAALGLKERSGLTSDPCPTALLTPAAPGLLPNAVLWQTSMLGHQLQAGSPVPGGSPSACLLTVYHLWPGLPSEGLCCMMGS